MIVTIIKAKINEDIFDNKTFIIDKSIVDIPITSIPILYNLITGTFIITIPTTNIVVLILQFL